jgi:maltose O-acetyltransferase
MTLSLIFITFLTAIPWRATIGEDWYGTLQSVVGLTIRFWRKSLFRCCHGVLSSLPHSTTKSTTYEHAGGLREGQNAPGELYQAFEAELTQERQNAKQICFEYNQTSPLDQARRKELLKQLLGRDDAWVESPFHVDYGYNLRVGQSFYANHGVTILDGNQIVIGKNCLLAPHVCISAATHPLSAELRVAGYESTMPITIGDNAWIGANVTICPGVTLGDNVVVAAGAVVTKGAYPSDVVLAGVPATILPTKESGKTD